MTRWHYGIGGRDAEKQISVSRFRLSWLLVSGLLLAATGAGFAVAIRLEPTGSAAQQRTTAIEGQVKAYFDVQLQITIIPEGAQPGKLTPVDVAELQLRVINQLPKVMTGRLLSSQTQGFYAYFSELAQTDTAIVVLGGGVDAIAFDSPPTISGDAATISGTCANHSDSYHLEKGKRVSDSFRATNSFTAQLSRQNDGSWLVSSMSTTVLSTQSM